MGSKKVYPESNPSVLSSKSLVGDVLFYDNKNNKNYIFRQDESQTLMNQKFSHIDYLRYTPIGIVVVPGTHDRYGDGSCGVMALPCMAIKTPTVGSSSSQISDSRVPYMCWGNPENVSLSYKNSIPIGNTDDGIPTSSYNQSGYLPSDDVDFTSVICAHDNNSNYSVDDNSTNLIPSPYLTNGDRNLGYSQTTSPMDTTNCLADFNGRENTNAIITARGERDYTTWLPDNIIDDYPAASCCDMFYTLGTNQGNWYLPSIGELGYLEARIEFLNNTILALEATTNSDWYSKANICNIDSTINYLSSTLYSSSSIIELYTSIGNVRTVVGSQNRRVRAFVKFNNLPKAI